MSPGTGQLPGDGGRGGGQSEALGHLRGPSQGPEVSSAAYLQCFTNIYLLSTQVRLRSGRCGPHVLRHGPRGVARTLQVTPTFLPSVSTIVYSTKRHIFILFRTMWHHQIRRFCPQTPIILVGCKNDTRFIYKDEQYLRYCKERSPLVRWATLHPSSVSCDSLSISRQVQEKDIVMPDQGKQIFFKIFSPKIVNINIIFNQ